jgi:hypothetical protein
MSFGPGTQRILLLTAAGFFGVFFVIAFVFRRMDVQRPIAGFLADHPTVVGAVGHPVSVGSPAGQVPTGTGPGQANLSVPVSGPFGRAQVDLVMARLSRRWEVLSAALVRDGEREPLAGRAPEGDEN